MKFSSVILFITSAFLFSCSLENKEQDTLEQDFISPKTEQKPYVWWHWMGPNFSLEGITKDLEAMKEQGIGGATIFNITSAVQESQVPTKNNPWPDQVYRGEMYWAAIKHAAAEADRLGLEIGLHNTVGYSTTGGPWITEAQSMQRVLYYEKRVMGGGKVSVNLPVPNIPDRRGWGGVIRKLTEYKDIAVMATPADTVVGVDKILNITECMDSLGNLNWDAPQGEWIITRFISASTGVAPHPLPDELIDNKTFEADKMTLENTEYHWRNVIEPLKEHIGEYMGGSFKHFLIDSYEAGMQSWCNGFRDMFIAEKGYDPLPWMVTIPSAFRSAKRDAEPKRVIGDSLLTVRFEWDYRDFIAQMYVRNGWEPAARMINNAGCVLQFEPYGGPIDILSSVPVADIPMGEFWVPNSTGIRGEVAGGARAAGAKIIGAEAFTGAPQQSQWVEDPAYLKRSGDYAFLSGVNRLIFHHWVHQPYDDKYKPGMGMGWWGTHFGRHQTWAEAGKGYFDYLARCQAVLQRGEQVVDYLTVGKATGGDAISWRNFIKEAKVDDGEVVLQSGRRYKFVQLPEQISMQAELIEKVYELMEDGAVFTALVKPQRSEGLTNYPVCDETVVKLADAIWGNDTVDVNCVGDGKLLKMKPSEAMEYLGLKKTLLCDSKSMRYIHKKYLDNDIFFVLNDSKDYVMMDMSFAVGDRAPEIWDPYTGEIRPVLSFDVEDGRARFKMTVSPNKSFFVVFRNKIESARYLRKVNGTLMDNSILRRENDGKDYCLYQNDGRFVVEYSDGVQGRIEVDKRPSFTIMPSNGWTITYKSKADDETFTVSADTLIAWNESDDERIRYFSGTATYTAEFVLPDDYNNTEYMAVLDLGGLKNIAEITVNDSTYFNLWHAPFVIADEKLDRVLRKGENKIEISITNTWKNRLIGDEQFESDLVWGRERHWGKHWVGRPLAEYPEWFINNEPRPVKERKTFVIWNYFTKDSDLERAGMWGPVELKIQQKSVVKEEKEVQ